MLHPKSLHLEHWHFSEISPSCGAILHTTNSTDWVGGGAGWIRIPKCKMKQYKLEYQNAKWYNIVCKQLSFLNNLCPFIGK